MKLSLIAATLFLFASLASAQDIYRVNGVIKTKDLSVVPGLSLSVEKDGKEYTRNGSRSGGLTDINGHFVLELEPGKYKVTASRVPEGDFVLHLMIDDGPRPQDLELTIDPAALCDADAKLPTILKSATPVYPPAARAVRAVGTVTVAVSIARDGTVTSAQAVSGHPLLRSSSQTAATQFLFEGSVDDVERKVTLSFIFTDGVEAQNLNRYECPYRIMVVQNMTIDISTN